MQCRRLLHPPKTATKTTIKTDRPTHIVATNPTGPVVAEDVAKMPLLAGAINEALRLYSAAPNTRRVATRDCELGGYAIPKGSDLILDLWAMHRVSV